VYTFSVTVAMREAFRGAECRLMNSRHPLIMLHRRDFLVLSAGAAFAQPDGLDEIARRYVHLVLALGLHDPSYVDAYYGPSEWKEEVERSQTPLDDISAEAGRVVIALEQTPPNGQDEFARLRHRYLLVQTKSLIARAKMLQGEHYSFDEESRLLYDAVAPDVPQSRLEETLASLDKLIPGTGPVSERFVAWQKQFYVPAQRFADVIQAAIAEARTRLKRHIRLPENETFSVEYINENWGGASWYQGNAHSLLEFNADLIVGIDRALRTACHEGYPGHHVWNVLRDDRLMRGRGWLEYSVFAAWSPETVISEGCAEYAVELAFPGPQRAIFHEEVLFPRAGLEPGKARRYLQVMRLKEELEWARVLAARRYLDGEISREQCQNLLETYALVPPEVVERRVRFTEATRSFVMTYSVGKDLVRRHMTAHGADGSDARAWREFETLMSLPQVPSGLSR
jgi:hypothetical protein